MIQGIISKEMLMNSMNGRWMTTQFFGIVEVAYDKLWNHKYVESNKKSFKNHEL